MSDKIGVAVIGSGTMGAGIAQVAATAGHKVVLIDSNDSALDNAKRGHEKIFNRLVEKGKYTQMQAHEILSRINYHLGLNEVCDCHLVIEAIVENIEVKQKLFSEIELILSKNAVIASNTSSLSIASIASSCDYSSRVVGLHFFNPAPLLPLVEVVPSLLTDSVVVEEMVSLMKSWGKIPVLAKDTPGFIVNRVARPFYGESLRIYEEGVADFATIDWALKTFGGFRMGPFELMDLIGNDINYTVTETVFKEFYNDARYKPSFTQKRMVEAKLFGRKSEKGYFSYAFDAENPSPNKDEALGMKIFERVWAMLANEAADALFWNIATKEDIDLAMTKGVNYPKGLLAWVDELGAAKAAEIIESLREKYSEDRYRVSPILKEKAIKGEKFF
jgi:3-hydroxybutyryl-CoA dehydrogenase